MMTLLLPARFADLGLNLRRLEHELQAVVLFVLASLPFRRVFVPQGLRDSPKT